MTATALERPRCLRRCKDEKRPLYRFRVQNMGFVAMGALGACFKRGRNSVDAASAKCPFFAANANFETLPPITSSNPSWC